MDIILSISFVITLAGVIAIAYGFGRMHERIKQLEANYGHTAVGRARRDVAEEFSFQQGLLKNDVKIIEARLAYMDRVAQANMNPTGAKSK